MSHIDVVAANPKEWEHHPFKAEIHDGFVYGRGAIDMLNLTATQAVAFSQLVKENFKPKGDLIYLAVYHI